MDPVVGVDGNRRALSIDIIIAVHRKIISAIGELACAVRRGGIARPVCEEEAAGNLPHKRKGAALFAALHRLFFLLLG